MIEKYFKGEEKEIFEAMWQYILDHSDLSNDGVLFVKFHCKSKKGFAEKITSRMKGIYRDGWKEEVMQKRRNDFANKDAVKSQLAKIEAERISKENKGFFNKLFDKIWFFNVK